MLPFFDFHHTVAEEEIDAQRHVHNLRYLQWTLWAAGAHWRTAEAHSPKTEQPIGASHTSGNQQGAGKKLSADRSELGWVVRHHDVTYRAAALAGDQIVVRTWVADVQRFASRRRYVVCRPADRTVLTRVETRWVYVDLSRHKVVAIPEHFREMIPVLDEAPSMPWE